MTLISVVIPTYRRPKLLARAIESVRAQTFSEFEIVISDDEGLTGETGAMLRANYSGDDRIRVLGNGGPTGQVSNTNNALRVANGAWIKLLHDDDVLKPNCLKRMIAAARAYPEAVSVTCRADYYLNGALSSAYKRGNRPLLETISRDQVHLAMLTLQDVGGAQPSLQMVSRRICEQGIFFEEIDGMRSLVDSCWNARVRAIGPSLILNESLVEWHQGQHPTETSTRDLDQLDEEFIRFRPFVYGFIPAHVKRPSLDSTVGLVRLHRGVSRLTRRRWISGFAQIVSGMKPTSLMLLPARLGYPSHYKVTRSPIPFPIDQPGRTA